MAINKVYLGEKLVERIYLGENLVSIGIGETVGDVQYADLPSIPSPIDSIVSPVINTSMPSVSSSQIALLGSLGISSANLGGFSVDCKAGLPTKADITNAFNKIAQIPSQLKQSIIDAGEDLAEDAKKEIEDLIKQVEDIVEKISEFLSPYWSKGKIRNWQKEAKDAWDELIQEFHIFIPVKMLEMISKLIPVDFTVNILGIQINVLKIFTREEQDRIKQEIIDKVPELPDAFDYFTGNKLKVKCDEWRAKYTWQYIKNEIIEWCTNALWKAFGALIKKFKAIWKKLGLPALPDLLSFDVEGFINSIIQPIIDDVTKTVQEKVDKIKNLSILGKRLIDIIGGEINETVLSGEELVADLVKQVKAWFAQWQKELLNQWIKKIKKFLDKIGLGKLLDLLTLTFCDVLKLIGIPTSFDLKLSV